VTQTIQQILAASFTLIGVVADGKQPNATQSAKGLELLNDNLLTQQRDGWHLGWYPITSITNLPSPAPLRDEDIGDVKLVLCSWLAPAYGITIPPSPDPNDPSALINQIKMAFTRLTKRSLLYTESDLGELQRPQGGPWGGPNWL
jgi:hypothetical protein